jgi:vacuolar-type H+-ATPase subunit I/STV1
MKSLTREQLEKRKEKAVRFARDVREDDELADQIENESLQEYAEHRHITLLNPTRRMKPMPVPTRRELMERIEELEGENEDLQTRLDEIADLAAEEEEEEEPGE